MRNFFATITTILVACTIVGICTKLCKGFDFFGAVIGFFMAMIEWFLGLTPSVAILLILAMWGLGMFLRFHKKASK